MKHLEIVLNWNYTSEFFMNLFFLNYRSHRSRYSYT